MATYALWSEVVAFCEGNQDVTLPGDSVAQERLLREAERAVDRSLGPWALLSTGLKIDPAALDLVQRPALSRATCAAAEHIAMLDPAFWVGDDDFLPNEVSILRRAPRVSPKMIEQLAGQGLIRRSGTVATSPSSIPVWTLGSSLSAPEASPPTPVAALGEVKHEPCGCGASAVPHGGLAPEEAA
ncbi:MAG TPA: hypothetical protein VNI55_13985 [Gaiellaceae bacterium]|nr:hypothetical protein [Gaiellaceae bacterium]